MICGLVLSTLLVAGTAPAFGDADEASAHGQAVGGIVRTTEYGATGLGSVVGIGGRFTLARSDRWAMELQATGLRTATRYDDITITIDGTPHTGVLERTQ